jgi:hypothetical protein
MSLTTGVEHERDRHPLGAHAVARDTAGGVGGAETIELLPSALSVPDYEAASVKVSERLVARPRDRHYQLRGLQELIVGVAPSTAARGTVDLEAPRHLRGLGASGPLDSDGGKHHRAGRHRELGEPYVVESIGCDPRNMARMLPRL